MCEHRACNRRIYLKECLEARANSKVYWGAWRTLKGAQLSLLHLRGWITFYDKFPPAHLIQDPPEDDEVFVTRLKTLLQMNQECLVVKTNP